MVYLVWGGAVLTLASVAMLGWCVVMAMRIRKAGLDDGAKRARLQKVLIWNIAALALAAFGLMAVMVGVIIA
jgi:uncharacterized membrane protein YqjE